MRLSLIQKEKKWEESKLKMIYLFPRPGVFRKRMEGFGVCETRRDRGLAWKKLLYLGKRERAEREKGGIRGGRGQ